MTSSTEVSDTPRHAPADHASLPSRVVTSDGNGLWQTWHGSGQPTTTPCAACGNVEENTQVYGNWGHSYPNGNSWDDEELRCGACARYTAVYRFTEG